MGKVVFITLAVAALSALLGERAVNLRRRILASREPLQNHLPRCGFLQGIADGSEDIALLDDGGAFISSGFRDPGAPTPHARGKIVYLNLQDPDLNTRGLEISGDLDLDSFNPHGISVYIDPTDDKIYLFVVNHPDHKSQVEVFLFSEEDVALVHVKTIKHELLHSVNDVVAVGVDSFYATNDHYFSHRLLRGLVEPLLGLPWGDVVFHGPGGAAVVARGFYFANGINVSPDGRFVYVVDLLDHKVHVMERTEGNSLVPVKTVEVGSLCDNVQVEQDSGDLWLGCHPNGWRAFMMDPENPPGSEVIRIQDVHSDQPVVTQVFMDDGRVIMGSSAAAVYGGKLLIGTVFHKALHCDLQ